LFEFLPDVHQQLRPLLARDQMSRYIIRIFAWENVRPSKVLTNFVSTGAMPFLASATELVRHFLPADTSDQDAMCAAISAYSGGCRGGVGPRR
jgi:TetR/AcrR family transcriptional regulator, regulator of cefoperazone and chloramphenicol sensitivity